LENPVVTTSDGRSRRRFLAATVTGALGAAGSLALASCSPRTGDRAATAPGPTISSPRPGAPTPAAVGGVTPAPLATNADQALQLLTEGNQRFVDDHSQHLDTDPARRLAVRTSQVPFATILSCVDSRVPVELVFDRGLGDLVVIRSAGEVLDRSVVGSLEFGVAELKTPLLVVLGHQRCGALTAAVTAYDNKSTDHGDLGYLEQALAPAVQQAVGQTGDRITNAVRANVGLTLAQLRQSAVLGPLETQRKVKMVGAYYSLDTGRVDLI
jgi:carbonic anhydrase